MAENPITVNAYHLLEIMVKNGGKRYPNKSFHNKELQTKSELEHIDFIDALSYLENLGAVSTQTIFGIGYLGIFEIFLYPKGRFLLAEYQVARENSNISSAHGISFAPFNPVGSPYGFTEEDWQIVARRKQDADTLYVVVGMQFQSEHYDPAELMRNLRLLFNEALQAHNGSRPEEKLAIHFEALAAGLGQHLFNRIAQGIIGADIAVFETSDLNPNVMLEMGIALTWGVAVLPIRRKGMPAPPSDISGQTWVEYEDSAKHMLADDFEHKLTELIRNSMSRKRVATTKMEDTEIQGLRVDSGTAISNQNS